MRIEYDIFNTLLSSDDLTPTIIHQKILVDIILIAFILFLPFSVKINANKSRKKARNSKERDEVEKDIANDKFFCPMICILLLIELILINSVFYNEHKEYNQAYEGDLKFYQVAELKEGLPITWRENKEEIYHKALERFKNNPDDFNLETACKEYENDNKKPAACGGDLNTPLETTINGEDTTVTVNADVYKDASKDDKLSVNFVYKFN